MKKSRNSSIELLKIIALILIALSHSLPNQGADQFVKINLVASRDINIIIMNIMSGFGIMGNTIFIMCSSYFLIDSTKTKKEKILNIIYDSFTISILFLIIHLLLKINLTPKEIIKQFFPITFENNWFIGCYLLLYIVHPYLNKIINSFNKKGILRINVVLFILYSCVNIIKEGYFYYTSLIGFIILYFTVAYVKLYMVDFSKNIKLNTILLVISIFMYIGIILIFNFLGLRIAFFSNKVIHWTTRINMINPIYIVLCIALLNIFNGKNFCNKRINYISSLSLLFYLIHGNNLLITYIKPYFYQYVLPYGHILFWVFFEAITLFIGGLILSALYKETLQKLVYIISNKSYKLLKNTYLKIEEKLLKYN